MEGCIFCRIAKGEIPCNKIYEDNDVIAFLDINPINEGHTLVVPKKHCDKFSETDDEELGILIKAVKKIEKEELKDLQKEHPKTHHAVKMPARPKVQEQRPPAPKSV